jgi:hypothetical protein
MMARFRSHNLCRAARRANIETSLLLTRAEIEGHLQAFLHEMYQLKAQAPDLRRKHLQWQLSLAQARDDKEAEQEIKRITQREAARQWQRKINQVVCNPSGRSVLSVKIPLPDGTTHRNLRQQHEVEQACGEHLGN